MLQKIKNIYTILRHGQYYAGIQKKPILYAGHVYYDGDHWVIHLGWFYLGLSY